MPRYDEYSKITQVAIRSADKAFVSEEKLQQEWQPLRFHSKPELNEAVLEYAGFLDLLAGQGTDIVALDQADNLTIDSIYTRDSILVSPEGLILCNMGRGSRTPEAAINARAYEALGHKIAGQITAPGTLEGGDFIWLDQTHAAVGLGPRTNADGIRQLKDILGPDIELHIVPLPEPNHPDDVLHLMSIISPLDQDLALIYRPFMPRSFIAWLEQLGIQFVEVPDDEYEIMGCNVLAIAPRQAIMLENLPGVKTGLENAGVNVATYKGIEISRKGEGGPTCLTRPLERC
ncbi:arginine deiminase family protein [bacterium]|jgi:N-dimethylarginine dimethylaminohydrolase|nr:arginine deiminase family protein [Porticoccaceae bacterium]MDC3261608.1 arginine deiminase family protein [bacterium]